jgi:nucleoside-diphosphate-sugar epimerase
MKNIKNSILIIGHSGYVGSVLVEYLNRKKNLNYKIFGLDTNWYLFNNYLYKYNKKLPYISFYYDCRNFRLESINFIPETIVYLAAVSNDPMGKEFQKATYEINLEACLRIAKQSKLMGVKKFIFASSCSIYGSSGDSLKKENDCLQPISDYAISKVRAEEALEKLADNKFKIIALRFATAAGMSPNLRLDLVFNDFVANAVKFNRIKLLSRGDSWRPLIHVDDMAKAIYWAHQHYSNKNFLPINVGSKEWTFTIIDLAKKISSIINNSKIIIKNKKVVDKRSYTVDFSLYKKLAPVYFPRTNIDKSVIELKNFLLLNKHLLLNFRESKIWSRLSCLRYLIKSNQLNKKLFWK